MVAKKRRFTIRRLDSGGLIPNYYCTSRCRHCLYACSPQWEKRYIDPETTEQNILKIKGLGCRSIHIGGGEPFLNLDGLNMVMDTAHSLGVDIEYVETNSSWYRDRDSTCQILSSLEKRGLSMLLISISPFHNEHIPFYKVKGVIEACHGVGIKIFPWISAFFSEITALGDQTTHSLSEYETRYGTDYLKKLPSRYWIHLGGRALDTFSHVLGAKACSEILSDGKKGCRELLDVSHFHLDLFGNYIPGLCSGLAIDRDDLGYPISPGKYPLLHTLFDTGVTGLFERVSKEYDFKPAKSYLSKCHLCFDLRRHLVLDRGIEALELQPRGFYENI